MNDRINNIFRWRRKTDRLSIEVMSDSKLFHRADPNTVNSLAPTVKRRTRGMRRWLDDADHSNDRLETTDGWTAKWTVRGILEHCRAVLGGPGPPVWIECALGFVTNAAISECWKHSRIVEVRRSDASRRWAPTLNFLPTMQVSTLFA